MAQRIPWDKYEAVILLEACLEVREGKSDRNEVVRRVSRELRKRATDRGIQIDDIYRNENGISLQLLRMNDTLMGGKANSHASKLFVEIVDLYKNDYNGYLKLLRGARPMIGDSQKTESNTQHPFINWLINKEKMSSRSANVHYGCVRFAEFFAVKQQLSSTKLISATSYSEAKETYDALVAKRLIPNKIVNSIKLYLKYLKDTFPENEGVSSEERVAQKVTSNTKLSETIPTMQQICFDLSGEKIEKYKVILREKFPKGFRLSSALDLRKFKAWYEEKESKPLQEDDNSIINDISSCGIVYEDKLFLAETLLSEEVREKLIAYIDNTFSSGAKAIYYNALYEEFRDDFSCERIYDSDMLSRYLENILGRKYHYYRSYFSSESSAEIDIDDEVVQCLIRYGAPVSSSTVCAELSHIPQDKIKQSLSLKSEFISNARGEYFHCSLINFSENDIAKISSLIDQAIDEKEFISASELIDSISKRYPEIIDNNAVLSELGFRNAIEYSLRRKYAFQGKVISKRGNWLSMSDVYRDFCKNKEQFTIEELKTLRDEIDSGRIYYEDIYQNSLRINRDTFVSRNNACFDVKATDSAIEMYMNGRGYIPLKEINSFGAFPYAGFPWNTFLLEHYVAEFSEKYRLVHASYSETGCTGAIVKKDLGITDLDNLVPLVLADSNIELIDRYAVSYLNENGYISVRRYGNISSALIKAKEIRNRRENK